MLATAFKRTPHPIPLPSEGVCVYRGRCARERGAAFTPLPRGTVPVTLRIFPSAGNGRTVKRPQGRAPAALGRGAKHVLSPGERENHPPSLDHGRDGVCPATYRQTRISGLLLPLPEGKGQGEGKHSVEHANCKISKRPVIVQALHRYTSLNPAATGSRAARIAGKSPPRNPMATAQRMAVSSSFGVTAKAKAIWLNV